MGIAAYHPVLSSPAARERSGRQYSDRYFALRDEPIYTGSQDLTLSGYTAPQSAGVLGAWSVDLA